jgi:hypothetical protein
MPPVYLRTQQLSWLEITTKPGPELADDDQDQSAGRVRVSRCCHATLQSARVELPGATWFERILAAARNPHSSAPKAVASWPEGPDWPVEDRHLNHRHLRKAKRAVKNAANCTSHP